MDKGHRKNSLRWLLLVVLLGLLIAGCSGQPGYQTPTSTPTPTTTPTPLLVTVEAAAGVVPTEQVLNTPTPAPTATPSPLDLAVNQVVAQAGIQDLRILGFSGRSLVNLLISILIVLVGSLLGSLLVEALVWLAKLTPTVYDEGALLAIRRPLKWAITLFLLGLATARLDFLPAGFKQAMDIVYFALLVVVFSSMAWRLIDFLLQGPLQRAASPQDRDVLVAFTPLLRRTLQFIIIIIALAIILQNVGFNLSALLAILGLGGLAVSLAAKETLEDMINGYIILIDRPFQTGDRIKIGTMDAWGDVESIGPRTTRIRTLDNRLVVVPNSVIGRNQVENFTYPNPSIRVKVELGVAYGSDIDRVVEVIREAVLNVPDVKVTEPPLVEFVKFGDSALIFRATYSLITYKDILVQTEVNKAIYQAMSAAKIEIPFTTYDVNLAYKNNESSE